MHWVTPKGFKLLMKLFIAKSSPKSFY